MHSLVRAAHENAHTMTVVQNRMQIARATMMPRNGARSSEEGTVSVPDGHLLHICKLPCMTEGKGTARSEHLSKESLCVVEGKLGLLADHVGHGQAKSRSGGVFDAHGVIEAGNQV